MITRQTLLKLSYVIATTVVGPISYLIYKILVQTDLVVALSVYEQRANVAIVLATFSMTILGFLAAIITMLFSLTHTRVFQRYEKRGRFSVLLSLYLYTVFSLLITFASSLFSFAKVCPPILTGIALMSATNNLVQIFLIALAIANLFRRSASDSARAA